LAFAFLSGVSWSRDLCREIDRLVYGLTDDEIAVVEDSDSHDSQVVSHK